jgi:hypothetical protein
MHEKHIYLLAAVIILIILCIAYYGYKKGWWASKKPSIMRSYQYNCPSMMQKACGSWNPAASAELNAMKVLQGS